MRMVDLIERKKLGESLTDAQIRYIIEGFTDGSIPDYQMSAFAMAVLFRGMNDRETAVLTAARHVLKGQPVPKPPHLVLLKYSTN